MDLNKKSSTKQITVKTLRVQNNYRLKSSMVEFFSDKFLSVPTPGFELTTPLPPDLKSDALLCHGAKRERLLLQQNSKYVNVISRW